MKRTLIFIIRLYWAFIPEKHRRKCLFKETCSHFVFRHTVEEGFSSGMKALKARVKKCRKGYQLYHNGKSFELKLADGSIIGENEISPNILRPIYSSINQITEQYQKRTPEN